MRFVAYFGFTLGLILASAAGLNFVVNPYALYPLRWLAPVSVNNLEDSLRQIEKPEFHPDLMVLGSSRSARLRAADLKCYSGLESANQAYAGGTPEGYFALASYVLDNKPHPKMFIIGLDVEAFNEDAKFANRLQEIPRLARYTTTSNAVHSLWLDFTNLVSMAQVNDSLRVVWLAVVDPNAQQKAMEKDALAIENRAEATPKETIAHNLGRYRGYTQLSVEEQGHLEDLLRLAQQNGIEVKLYITTMHPQLIEALTRQGYYPARLVEVRNLLNRLRAQYPFEFYDFSTPDTFGGTLTDFHNLSHINEINSARLIGALFADRNRAAQCAVNS